jgi:hypothetical protein
VFVIADRYFQFGESFVPGVDPAQRVRQSPSGVGDHVGVTGVGLDLHHTPRE